MASFVLSLHSAPSSLTSVQLLYRYATAAIANGHTIEAVFLYQQGVYHAQQHIQVASDQLDAKSLWRQLKAKDIPLMLCVTAAESRGVECDSELFDIAGLAEFAMRTSRVDKWVQFK
ncbi:sulfurtransferase complex subunit TusD [Pseudoalteromonas fenneropenaei]|uniref:Sulfurtransferase complex subunit TusD n=1 Tax=Pseudoalteromonas fenneropenaei TaxID=1737459 RepID=A0ABV7CHN4_9GAMM